LIRFSAVSYSRVLVLRSKVTSGLLSRSAGPEIRQLWMAGAKIFYMVEPKPQPEPGIWVPVPQP